MTTSENLFPDLHHKMSKKIAQLTKVLFFVGLTEKCTQSLTCSFQVIYHLNSKNEDHQDDLTSLTDAYETEIDTILKVSSYAQICIGTYRTAIKTFFASYSGLNVRRCRMLIPKSTSLR